MIAEMIVVIGIALAVIAALWAILMVLSGPHRDDQEPVVGVQRQGRTYMIPRRLLEESSVSSSIGATLMSIWRPLTLGVLAATLLVAGLLRCE
ncbi:MAG: hypothetical protein M9890_09425 [Thermomicrobiales bacterium]|nr:hypothetical protein [Thermomicrobiales bacterium]